MKKFNRYFCSDFAQIKEASFNEDFSNGKMIVIVEGFNRNRTRFYTRESLENGYRLFEGLKMYANHEDDYKTSERGARDIRDWVATVTETSIRTIDGKIAVEGSVNVHSSWFKEFLKDLNSSKVIENLGVSINAYASGQRQQMEGSYTNVIDKFVEGRSVDFVSEAGAGGKMISFKEAKGNSEMDLENVSVKELKESAPNLYKEARKDLEAEIRELKESQKKSEPEKTKESGVSEIEKRLIAKEANIDRRDILIAALEANQLPQNVKDRIKESVLKSEAPIKNDRLDIEKAKAEIAKTIEAEESYVKSLLEAKSVDNGGSSSTESKKDVVMEGLEKSLGKMFGLETKEGEK